MGAREEGLAEEELTRRIIGAFFEVYNQLGDGFLENVYLSALEEVLTSCGSCVQREVGVPVWFHQKQIAFQRLDMMIDGTVIVEVKSTLHLPDSARRQLFSYLKATHTQVGLLLHFGQEARFHRVYHKGPNR